MPAEPVAAAGMRGAAAAMAAACALVLAACGGPLRAAAAGDPPSGTASRPGLPRVPVEPALTRAPTESASPGRGPLAGIDACSLAPTGVLGALGATGSGVGKQRTGIFRSACDWQVPGRYVLGIAVSDEAGLDALYAAGNSATLTIGTHRAVRAVDPQTDTCTVSLGVAPHARVDIDATGGDRRKLCAAAVRIAGAVEPRLPPPEG